jgi:hypothetical protein
MASALNMFNDTDMTGRLKMIQKHKKSIASGRSVNTIKSIGDSELSRRLDTDAIDNAEFVSEKFNLSDLSKNVLQIKLNSEVPVDELMQNLPISQTEAVKFFPNIQSKGMLNIEVGQHLQTWLIQK